MVRAMSGRPLKPRHLLLAATLGITAFTVGAALREPAVRAFFSPSFLTEWYRVGLVMRVVNTRYLESEAVPFDHLARNASAGAAARLDRYSEYLDATDYEAQNKHADQLFTGVGVSMRPVDGMICVERVMPGGGAETAGIRAGDRIMAADDTDLIGASLEQAAAKIKGAENTTVVLTLLRPGASERLRLEVMRRTIPLSSVTESRLLADGHTAYLLLSGFERRTPQDIEQALAPLLRAGADALILDLRGNPGGLVDAAVEVVGLFCPKQSTVVKIVGRNDDDTREYRTPRAPTHATLPLAVLVDSHSASASEIVAGALRDHGRAVLVGGRTFGKGIVQSIYSLDERTGLKLTTARYALPNGARIHGIGVTPDVTVDTTFAARVRLVTEEAQINHAGGRDTFVQRFGYTPTGDTVLTTAATLLGESRR